CRPYGNAVAPPPVQPRRVGHKTKGAPRKGRPDCREKARLALLFAAVPDGKPQHTFPGTALAVNGFAVEVDVETFDFDLLGDTQADHQVDHFQDDEGDDGAVHEGAEHIVELDQHLVAVAVDQPAFAERVDRAVGEHTGEDGAQRAAHAVNAPGIEGVVIAEQLLHMDRRDVADHTRCQADDERAHRIDEARRRSDRHKTGHRTGDHAQYRRFLGY